MFDPWKRKWQPTPASLPWEFHGPRSLEGYSPLSHKEANTAERLILLLSLSPRRSHWGELDRGYMASVCIISYNCIWIYSCFKISLIKEKTHYFSWSLENVWPSSCYSDLIAQKQDICLVLLGRLSGFPICKQDAEALHSCTLIPLGFAWRMFLMPSLGCDTYNLTLHVYGLILGDLCHSLSWDHLLRILKMHIS